MSPVKLFLVSLITALTMVLAAATQAPSGKQPAAPGAEERNADADTRLLDAAGLSSEGPGLLEYFRGRARTETKPGEVEELLSRFTSATPEGRVQAGTELVALGPLAAPALRRLANDLDFGDVRTRARRLLAWVEGPQSATLSAAAARIVAKRKPAGAAAALLAYLPFADNEEVLLEVESALRVIAVVGGKTDPAVIRALSDPLPLRRATAGAVLGQVGPGELKLVEKLLADANAEVRLVAALGLAKAYHAAAVPVLIEMLPVLPVQKRQQVETFLQDLAGEWAPVSGSMPDDEIALRIRNGAWASWWANIDGPTVQDLLRKRTLSVGEQEKVKDAIARLGHPSFAVREKATLELVAGGRAILPLLREAVQHNDPEVVNRVLQCMRRVEGEPAKRLPLAALRLLALRRPAGAAETLLAYYPFAEEEALDELHAALAVLALHDGKPEPALLQALLSARPALRIAAANALAKSGEPEALGAVRKLLEDADVSVRLRVGQALAPRDPHAVSILIGLMAELPDNQAWQLHDFLTRLVADKTSPAPEFNPDNKKNASAAWVSWWKENASRADLTRLDSSRQQDLGYVAVCEHNTGRIYELGRDRKPRWSFDGTGNPVDVCVLPNNRVLVAEINPPRVSERDLKGNIIWQKRTNGQPFNLQRLPNGHTLIATNIEIIEVDHNGKDVPTIRPELQQGQLSGTYKDQKGQFICRYQNGVCARLDASGKQLATFNTFAGHAWLDVTPNGRMVLAQNGSNKVVEYDLDGKVHLEIEVPNVLTATGLANGHILVCTHAHQVTELDRRGQTVWQYKAQNPFRARGR